MILIYDYNFESYGVCCACGVMYYYFDSPVAKKCFCGGELRKPTKEEETDIINSLSKCDAATVSC